MSDHLKHIAAHFKSLLPYQPGNTVDEIQRLYKLSNVIKLSSNENPLGPSQQVLDLFKSDIHELLSRYPEDQAPLLRDLLAKQNNIDVDQITLGAGSSEVIEMLAHLYLHQPNDTLITSDHAFVLYRVLAHAHHAQLIEVPDINWQYDLHGILQAIDDNTRVIMLANPNNPTGAWLAADELEAFIAQVPASVIVLIDEAYHEYMTDFADYASAIPLIQQYPNLVVSRTFSKLYALAGLRIGYLVSDLDIAEHLNRLRKPFNVNHLALRAVELALKDKTHQQQSLEMNRQGMQQLTKAFDELNLPYLATTGNFITVEFGAQTEMVAQELMKQGVIVRPIKPYKMPNHLRITVGTSHENAILIEKLPALLMPLIPG